MTSESPDHTNTPPTTFAALLRASRAKAGLSRSKLGALVGVSDQSIKSWEKEATTPSPQKQRAVLKKLEEYEASRIKLVDVEYRGKGPILNVKPGEAEVAGTQALMRQAHELPEFRGEPLMGGPAVQITANLPWPPSATDEIATPESHPQPLSLLGIPEDEPSAPVEPQKPPLPVAQRPGAPIVATASFGRVGTTRSLQDLHALDARTQEVKMAAPVVPDGPREPGELGSGDLRWQRPERKRA